ncbi:MAG: MotA/TolQ/ExbB proton channel family protein [Planctomycetota bacterium]
MFFQAKCPHCQESVKVELHKISEKQSCPYCKKKFEVLRAVDDGKAEKGANPFTSDVTDMRKPVLSFNTGSSYLWITGLFGALLTLTFYKLIGLLPKENRFYELFALRGFIPYVIAVLMFWSFLILLIKYIVVRRQRLALRFDLLPFSLSRHIHHDNIDDFIKRTLMLPRWAVDTMIVVRVRQALNHFKAQGKAQEVGALLNTQSDIQSAAIDSSYTMLRMFVWAIPVLGFIGTVVGIGEAIGGFSKVLEGAADIEMIKGALGAVTSGLGVAFDTTLVALAVGILIMFPMSAIQKLEEDMLNTIDHYCNDALLMRLVEAPAAKKPNEPSGLTADAIGGLIRLLQSLQQTPEPVVADNSEAGVSGVGQQSQ